MKADYWNVSDEQVIEKTGRDLKHWHAALDAFGALEVGSSEAVGHLQRDHGVARYWARTPVTNYLKARGR
ncbi:MAG: hypothetical protein H6697_07475 [Myxococcales bacterium]|nr:hypothetical protein [Myxococcales bacterium]MCB9520395.1 hypothetical protein [Myxococcales bacterium]